MAVTRGSLSTLSNTVTRLLARDSEQEGTFSIFPADAGGAFCEMNFNDGEMNFQSDEPNFKAGEINLKSDEPNIKSRVDEDFGMSTLICLGGFLMTLLVLYLFPLPSP